jgi:hypothetical protein
VKLQKSITLANIIMTEFEQEIVKPLINSGLIRFYKRYVDDTLILIGPSDAQLIQTILLSLILSILTYNLPLMNSATMTSISLTSTSIPLELLSIESPCTHTGQYSHI